MISLNKFKKLNILLKPLTKTSQTDKKTAENDKKFNSTYQKPYENIILKRFQIPKR